MIYFISDYVEIQEAANRLAKIYPQLAPTVRFVEYSQLLVMESLPFGTYVFTSTRGYDDYRLALAMEVESNLDSQGQCVRISNRPSQIRARERAMALKQAGVPISQISDVGKDKAHRLRQFHRITAPSPDLYTEEDISQAIVEDILNWAEPDAIRICDSTRPSHHCLAIGANLVELTTSEAPIAISALNTNFDVVGLEFEITGDDVSFISASDNLTDLLPAVNPRSAIVESIVTAYERIDTVGAGSFPLAVSLERQAEILGISCPS